MPRFLEVWREYRKLCKRHEKLHKKVSKTIQNHEIIMLGIGRKFWFLWSYVSTNSKKYLVILVQKSVRKRSKNKGSRAFMCNWKMGLFGHAWKISFLQFSLPNNKRASLERTPISLRKEKNVSSSTVWSVPSIFWLHFSRYSKIFPQLKDQ